MSGNRTDGTVLLTGATGLVGRHVLATLLSRGHRLRLAVRDPARLVDLPQTARENIEIATVGDLAEAPLGPALAGIETVVHVAGLAGGAFPAASFTRANVVATERLCSAARAAGVRRFVQVSSIMALTDNCAPAIVRDDAPPAPGTVYGRSKLAAEAPVAALGAEILAVVLRPPLVIAPDAGGNWRRLMRLAATRLPLPFASAGEKRSYIAADDLAEAIAAVVACDATPTTSGAYLVSSPPSLSLPEVIGALRRGMRQGPGLFPASVEWLSAAGKLVGARAAVDSLFGRLELDGSRFEETFGFHPRLPLATAMEQCGAAFAGASR
jgi:UDP-glucose 4-epimerase